MDFFELLSTYTLQTALRVFYIFHSMSVIGSLYFLNYIYPQRSKFSANCVLVIYLLIHKIRTAFHLTGHEEIGELFFERRKQWKPFNNPVILKQVTVVHIELEVNWG